MNTNTDRALKIRIPAQSAPSSKFAIDPEAIPNRVRGNLKNHGHSGLRDRVYYRMQKLQGRHVLQFLSHDYDSKVKSSSQRWKVKCDAERMEAMPSRIRRQSVGSPGHHQMDMKPLRLILLKRDSSERIERTADSLAQFLHAHPNTELLAVVVIEELDAATLDGSEVAVVLGGDGAIIRACRQFGKHQLPIIGINLGRLGFLADLTTDQFRERFEEIRTRRFEVVEHLMFESTLTRPNGDSESWLGVNEVAVSAEATLQMVEVALSIDDAPVTTYSCDGLIIATPVGSTAHSLSAGGPAIRQDLPVFAVTPICPHTLSNRSLVDDANRRYSLALPSARTEVVLVIDGQIRIPFRVGDRVDIGKADVTFKLVRMSEHNYFSVLENKLGWSGQPRYSAND